MWTALATEKQIRSGQLFVKVRFENSSNEDLSFTREYEFLNVEQFQATVAADLRRMENFTTFDSSIATGSDLSQQKFWTDIETAKQAAADAEAAKVVP